MHNLKWMKRGKKDYDTAVATGHKAKVAEILTTIRRNPFEPTPGHYFEALTGNLKGAYSRRINYHNRIVYTVHPNAENLIDPKTQKPFDGIVLIHRAWGHEYTEIDKRYLKNR